MAHAIGVVNINWNWCEFTLDFILGQLLNLPPRVGPRITPNIGNVAKCDIVVGIVEETCKDAILRDHIIHFTTCYSICRENRNLIIHGLCLEEYPEIETPVFLLSKASRELRDRAIPVTPEILERICRETRALYYYASRILDYWRSPEHFPLRDKLPLPHKLTKLHPALTV